MGCDSGAGNQAVNLGVGLLQRINGVLSLLPITQVGKKIRIPYIEGDDGVALFRQ